MTTRFFITLFLTIIGIHSSLLWAKNDAATKHQLEDVKVEIKNLSDGVSTDKASQAELFKQLKQQSKTISNLNKTLLELANQLKQQAAELMAIKQQQKQQQHYRDVEITALNKQIVAAYVASQPSFVNVLLSQQDPASLSRSSVYFHYFHQARQQQLIAIGTLLKTLTDNQKILLTAQKKQQKLYARQQQQQHSLKEQAQRRQQILRALDQKIADQDSRLALLRQQETSLHALLQSLGKTKENTALYKAFAKRTGSLVWPIKGKVLARYGSTRKAGKLKWQGIVIASPSGNEIIASASGRVVFSDWLRGFGLLMIIDHGDQYMTLYGNNETLLKQVGDNVVTGELIAQSGDKGVHQYAGLYFEIRHKGDPKNPLKWLDRKS